MRPRPYQLSCLAAIDRGFRAYDTQLAVLATGLGKTVIFSHLAAGWPNRVMVIAHRRELVEQAAHKIGVIDGAEPGIEMGQDRVEDGLLGSPRVVVSSVQTLSKRAGKFDPDEFGLLIIDEAHHAVAGTYSTVIAHFRQNTGCKVLGVTATPRRADELAMGQVFENCCFDYGIEPAIEDGWLVPVRQRVVTVEGLDFSNVRATAGDLNELDLERVLSEEKHLHAVAAPTVDMAGDTPCLVFCVTVNHAQLLAAVIDRYKRGSVAFLSGGTDSETRARTVKEFKEGRLQFLCNCGLFLEGFDAPNTAFVVMARPTKSLPLYMQILGRGTRALPGVIDPFAESDAAARRAAIAASAKPFMTVLDFVGNSGRHKIVTAADVLGGKYGEPVRQRALQVAAEAEEDGQGAIPVEQALDMAADEIELLNDQEEWRRRVRARKAHYQSSEVSPFAGAAGGGTAQLPPREMATGKQVWKLGTLGIPLEAARKMTKRQASAVIGKRLREGGLEG